MADTYVQVTNTGQTVFSLPFSSNYLLKSHVKVYKGRDLLAGTQTATLVDGTDYTFTSATQITLTTGLAAGEELTIQRQTPKDSQLSPWNDGSNLTAEALNKADLQCLYFTQEQGDLNALAATKAIASETASNTATTNVSTLTASQVNKDGSVAMTGNLQLGTNKITGVGDPTAAQDAVTKAYLERTGSIQSAQIQDGTLVDDDINNSAAIAQSKLDIADATTSASGYMSAADKTKLDGCDTGAKDDQTASEIKSLIASSPLDASHLAPNSVGDSEIATGALDNRYYTETECDAKYFNVSTGDTIKDGDAFPDNDTTIATTAAINDRIVDLLDDVGGFVPIANETSFPNANPDVNDGAGTLISIKALSSNLTSNGSGVATIANGTVGNSTVTITGLDNSTTYAATLGMIVETTTTLNTYAFHRQVPQGTNVTTVAGSISNVNSVASNISNVNSVAGNASNINSAVSNASNINTVAGSISNVNTVSTNISSVNDFADKYRIASSAPGSNNDDGDLYYNTSDNKLYIYNGSSWDVATSLSNSGGTVTGDITFSDGTKLKLGTGGDLKVYHNSQHSYLDNSTGQINIRSSGGIYLRNTLGTEKYAAFIHNNACKFYYDDSTNPHLETTSTGAKVTGDLKIDGTTGNITNNQYGHLFLQNTNNSSTSFWGLSPRDNGDLDIGYGTKTSGLISGDVLTLSSTEATFAGDVDLADSKKIKLGASDDLQIYHNGTHSYIDNSTGDLNIRANGDDLILEAADDVFITPQDGENGIKVLGNAAVELYYDSSKKLATASDGITVYGRVGADELDMGDDERVKLGASDDLQIYHNGSHSYIEDTGTGDFNIISNTIQFSNADNDEFLARFVENGAVDLYYDNSKKFETSGSGITVTDDDGTVNIKLVNNSGTAGYVYADGTNTGFLDSQADWLVKGVKDGAVELYYDNSKKFETISEGAKVTGDLGVDCDPSSISSSWTKGIRVNTNGGSPGGFLGHSTGSHYTTFKGDANRSAADLFLAAFQGYWNGNRVAEIVTKSGSDTTNKDDGYIVFRTRESGESITDRVIIDTDGDTTINEHLYVKGGGTANKLETYSEGARVNGRFEAVVGGNFEVLRLERTGTANGKFGFKLNNDSGTDCGLLLRDEKADATRLTISSAGKINTKGDSSGNYIFTIHNDGNDSNRYGLSILAGSDDASGTNYAVSIKDGDGTGQGYITFSGGTVSYGAFTAHHPCIVPDSENPSDSSNAYPYGTLLETISIEYTQKNGANTERGIRYKVQKTQSANSRKVLGAYGSSMNGGPDGQTNEHQALVLGDGHILVNNAGGNIEVGDGICSSATAGIGQKATANPSMIIGIAQEAVTFTGSETKLVAVQYGLQQFIPWT